LSKKSRSIIKASSSCVVGERFGKINPCYFLLEQIGLIKEDYEVGTFEELTIADFIK